MQINNVLNSIIAGSNRQVQFNSDGVLGADETFYWDKTGKTLNIGSGDNLTGYQFAPEGTKPATLIDIKSGGGDAFIIAPNTVPRPLFKAQTFQEISSAQVGDADGVDSMATIAGVSLGYYACEAQTVGVFGAATSMYNNPLRNSLPGALKGDTVGGYFLGVKNAYGNGTSYGTAIGAYIAGRRDDATAQVCAAEIQCQNYTATEGTYNSTGFSTTNGIFLTANGNADSGVGISIANPFGRKFKVGIGFSGWNGGAVVDSTFKDDGIATTSLDIRGTHTYSFVSDATSGKVGVGTLTPAAHFQVVSPGASVIASILQTAASPTAAVLEARNSAGTVQAGITKDFELRTTTGLGAPSTTPADGAMYVDTANHRLYVRSGGSWKYTNLVTDNENSLINDIFAYSIVLG